MPFGFISYPGPRGIPSSFSSNRIDTRSDDTKKYKTRSPLIWCPFPLVRQSSGEMTVNLNIQRPVCHFSWGDNSSNVDQCQRKTQAYLPHGLGFLCSLREIKFNIARSLPTICKGGAETIADNNSKTIPRGII